MPNIQDHALSIGTLGLDERPFDAQDALILSQLVYLPLTGLMGGGGSCQLREAWAYLRTQVDYDGLDIFQKKRYRLFETCAQLPRYAAWRLSAYDDVVDGWFHRIKEDLIAMISSDSSRGEEALDILMVAKYLERIGDHATNLAEWVEYAVTGQRSKDGAPYLPDVEKSGM